MGGGNSKPEPAAAAKTAVQKGAVTKAATKTGGNKTVGGNAATTKAATAGKSDGKAGGQGAKTAATKSNAGTASKLSENKAATSKTSEKKTANNKAANTAGSSAAKTDGKAAGKRVTADADTKTGANSNKNQKKQNTKAHKYEEEEEDSNDKVLPKTAMDPDTLKHMLRLTNLDKRNLQAIHEVFLNLHENYGIGEGSAYDAENKYLLDGHVKQLPVDCISLPAGTGEAALFSSNPVLRRLLRAERGQEHIDLWTLARAMDGLSSQNTEEVAEFLWDNLADKKLGMIRPKSFSYSSSSSSKSGDSRTLQHYTAALQAMRSSEVRKAELNRLDEFGQALPLARQRWKKVANAVRKADGSDQSNLTKAEFKEYFRLASIKGEEMALSLNMNTNGLVDDASLRFVAGSAFPTAPFLSDNFVHVLFFEFTVIENELAVVDIPRAVASKLVQVYSSEVFEGKNPVGNGLTPWDLNRCLLHMLLLLRQRKARDHTAGTSLKAISMLQLQQRVLKQDGKGGNKAFVHRFVRFVHSVVAWCMSVSRQATTGHTKTAFIEDEVLLLLLGCTESDRIADEIAAAASAKTAVATEAQAAKDKTKETKEAPAVKDTWVAYPDQEGDLYYHNLRTNGVVWVKPEIYEKILTEAEYEKQNEVTLWVKMLDEESGDHFFYNPKTDESDWDRPEGDKVKVILEEEWLDIEEEWMKKNG
mmetsp:Transcript_7699/g.14611  ORF Transcript_7699/g.14611 Transcript_7699/m.14611 type:complete len:702 (-) Transcript_7699:125-2230(-)